jgi:2-methylisocitrate lyase-like PEP mutase family enzyme
MDFTALRTRFRELHQSGCFVIPNPWDAGSARYLEHLGFQALATTSSGFAFSRGLPDGGYTGCDAVVVHVSEIVAGVDIPVNTDFESGYAREPEGVAENVRRCADAGASGLSIEDSTGDPVHPLYELPIAVERIRAARAALEGTGVLLTGRAECFLTGHPDPLREAVRRLQGYAEAGADVLFAPGIHAREDIRTLVDAVSPKPVNVLVGWDAGFVVSDLADLGVRRISVGSGLARAAWTGFLRAARELADGSFAGFRGLTPYSELNDFFVKGLKKTSGRSAPAQ